MLHLSLFILSVSSRKRTSLFFNRAKSYETTTDEKRKDTSLNESFNEVSKLTLVNHMVASEEVFKHLNSRCTVQ